MELEKYLQPVVEAMSKFISIHGTPAGEAFVLYAQLTIASSILYSFMGFCFLLVSGFLFSRWEKYIKQNFGRFEDPHFALAAARCCKYGSWATSLIPLGNVLSPVKIVAMLNPYLAVVYMALNK